MTPQLEQTIRAWVANSHGWMSPERAIEMAQLVLDNKPKICVEIGVFGGRSLVSQALALKELDAGIIYGIDSWKTLDTLEGENDENKGWWSTINLHDIHKAAAEGIWKYNLDKYAVLVRSQSQHCHDLFRKIHMLMIDGNHSEIASCRDVHAYLPKVAQTGIIVMDDTDWPSTKTAQEIVAEKCSLVKDGVTYKIFKKL